MDSVLHVDGIGTRRLVKLEDCNLPIRWPLLYGWGSVLVIILFKFQCVAMFNGCYKRGGTVTAFGIGTQTNASCYVNVYTASTSMNISNR